MVELSSAILHNYIQFINKTFIDILVNLNKSVHQNSSVQVVCIELRSRSGILRVAAVNKLTMGLPLRQPTTENKTKNNSIRAR